jgi:hypothetical protein
MPNPIEDKNIRFAITMMTSLDRRAGIHRTRTFLLAKYSTCSNIYIIEKK